MSELALKRIKEEYRKQTGKLDLGNCGLINYLPEELFELTWLEELRISNDRDKSKKNDFQDYMLPGGLSKLSNLKILGFGGSFGKKWSILRLEILANLSSLQVLSLDNNQLSDLSILAGLSNLQKLYLSNNQLSDLSPLAGLSSLQSLDLDNNQLSDLSPLAGLSNLNLLYLSNNQLSDLSPLAGLSNLHWLYLQDNQLSDLSPLAGLSNLHWLYLQDNQLSDISPLAGLSNLKQLYLDHNQLSDLSPLAGLSSLKSLYLRDNQLSDISPLAGLSNLKWLNLENNQVSDLSQLAGLRNLQELNLQNNQLSDISPLAGLSNLQVLLIQNNQVVDLTGLVKLYRNNCEIVWDENPVEQPPQHILEQGTDAIVNYIEQVEQQGTENLYEARIIIAGEGKSGKTTLYKKLTEENVKVPDEDQESTHGINIFFGRKFDHRQNNGVKISANIWDFGGQDIQTYLHQYFFASKSLFLLVCDSRSEKTNFDYWFEIISRLCEDIRVIVIHNIRDRETELKPFNISNYTDRYSNLKIKALEVNFSVDDTKWDLLIQTIEERLSEIDRVNEAVPAYWKQVKEKVYSVREEDKKYIDYKEFVTICGEAGLSEETEQELCLDYLHWLGYALHYEDSGLDDYIFVDPEWITRGLYEVLRKDNYPDELESKGRFEKNEIFNIWKEKGYNRKEKNLLLELLAKDKFDVCYQIGKTKRYLVPILINNTEKTPKYKQENKYTTKYKFPFMPFGFFSRLVVRLYELIWGNYVWHTGVWLKNEQKNCIAFLRHNESDKTIEINIYGAVNDRIEMLGFIRTEVTHIKNQLYKEIKIDEMIPCPCEICKTEKVPHYHSRINLDRIRKNGALESQCQVSGKMVSILTLLNSIISESDLNNEKSKWGKEMKEKGIYIHNDFKDSFNQEMNNEQRQIQKTDISIDIDIKVVQQMHGELANLAEDINDERKLLEKSIDKDEVDVTLMDVTKAENAMKEIEQAISNNHELPPRAKSRFGGFIDDLKNEKSTLRKTLGILRKGKDYGVSIAETYNKFAQNLGMPSVPPLIIDALKLIK